jgi:hypothetical protein
LRRAILSGIEEKGRKSTRKQGKNLQVKKAEVLSKDASTESGSQSPKHGNTLEKIFHTWRDNDPPSVS